MRNLHVLHTQHEHELLAGVYVFMVVVITSAVYLPPASEEGMGQVKPEAELAMSALLCSNTVSPCTSDVVVSE